MGSATSSTTVPPLVDPDPGRRREPIWDWPRWVWRYLTSMRTAVVLLVLLALTAVPGSLLPQRGVASDPVAVPVFYRENPELAPWLDRLWLFDVYASPWFAAVYVLLLVSMTGCVIPRCRTLWRQAREAPPPAPRRLDREPSAAAISVRDVNEALDAAAAHLRSRRFRVVRTPEEVRATKGSLREIGNLGFHLSLLALLIGIAGGRLYGYEGRVAVIEGKRFTNIASEYDALSPAPWADLQDLEPLDFTLERFTARFESTGTKVGEPREFEALVAYRSATEGQGTAAIRPNEPLEVNGTKFFLTGHGYAPRLTVRGGDGEVAFSGPKIFLPSDPQFTSDGVVKVPDAQPESLAFEGVFLPTAVEGPTGAAVSAFPGPVNPRVQFMAYTGDLGMDDGVAQSVFTLDFGDLDRVRGSDGKPWRVSLAPGETAQLPRGLGTISFDGVSRFANFQVARDPGKEISLVAGLLLLVGLTMSLSISRRRVWVRPAGGKTVELAGRSLSRRTSTDQDLARLRAAIDTAEAEAEAEADKKEPQC